MDVRHYGLSPNATIELNLKFEAGASLAWLPHETILFDRARLARSVDVALADDATLVFAEAVVFGRLGMGETVRHGLLRDNWRIYRGGRILHAEALRLEGEIACKLAHPAVAKGARAMAELDSPVTRSRSTSSSRPVSGSTSEPECGMGGEWTVAACSPHATSSVAT